MKAVKFIVVVSMMILLISSCDRRGSVSTGTPEYEIAISANPLIITINDSSAISVIVSEYVSNEPLGGVLVKFYAIDFGSVTPQSLSSSINPTGLDEPVYFYPTTNVGVARIVGQSISSNGLEVTDSDTVAIQVF